MTSETPLSVSVIVPTHNREDWLNRVLESIEALDYPSFEIVVVDDGSQDSTPALLREWAKRGVRSVRHDRARGASAARNSGLSISTGDLVAFIDDDALPEANWLQHLADPFVDEQVGAVGGAVFHLGTGDPQSTGNKANRFGKDRKLSGKDGLGPGEFIVLMEGNMSVRRDLLDRIGGFDPQIRIYGEGVDLCLRIARAGYRVVYTSDAVVWHAKANGPYRGSLYHPHRNRIYLSLKNFGSPLHLVQLFFYDSALWVGNIMNRLGWLLTRRITLRQFLTSCMEMLLARIDGYRDGISAWRAR